ncbi:dermonecrotic toxin StSicTox-betaIB1i-like [Oppia nitens]|uniref:dermonecrotic toxin StSicTox-betaIB1i-like n=1 Tax=Oppia nitens TaxID=1686743 RepID=UPI0023DAA1D6|nr:dermonecrotic toxin StSicTox-betaIB1i-like [Oppia nitens]
MIKLMLISVVIMIILIVHGDVVDGKKPLYIIGHMANSIDTLNRMLDEGANAIETDLSIYEDSYDYSWVKDDSTGGGGGGSGRYTVDYDKWIDAKFNELVTYHGDPCDKNRNCDEIHWLTNYLVDVSNITTPGNQNYRENFLALIIDLKISHIFNHKLLYGLGYETCFIVSRMLFKNSNVDHSYKQIVKVIFSSECIADMYDFYQGCQTYIKQYNDRKLRDYVGWDLSTVGDCRYIKTLGLWALWYNKKSQLGRIEHMWLDEFNEKNVWQGDGITNRHYRSFDMIKQATGARDTNKVIKKVYRWTIDEPRVKKKIIFGITLWQSNSIGATLDNDVDGVMTNTPRNIINYMNNHWSHKYYLATQQDPIFQVAN